MADNKVGRIAFRVEGNIWVAYYALPDTMDNALFLGSIAMSAVRDPERKETFMNLIKDTVGEVLKEEVNCEVTWKDPTEAPEHEKSGRA